MIAGGPNNRIWFTNVIYKNTLYTQTYKWPNVAPTPCSKVGPFSRAVLNEQILNSSRFVGREILQQRPRRYVNHWRVSVVAFPFPVAEADWYVDQRNRSTIWQVLHFGLQNLFDPEQDEWMRMRTFRHRPGRVTLPPGCPPPGP